MAMLHQGPPLAKLVLQRGGGNSQLWNALTKTWTISVIKVLNETWRPTSRRNGAGMKLKIKKNKNVQHNSG